MEKFMDEDFLLTTPTAKWLYHEVAKKLPIIDYHCHIDPRDESSSMFPAACSLLSITYSEIVFPVSFLKNDFRHTDYEEEMRVYRYVRDGDPRAPEEARRRFTAGRQGHLSDDPLTNMKYLFVASMTLIIRFAITGGSPE